MKIYYCFLILFLIFIVCSCSEQRKIKIARKNYNAGLYTQAFDEYMPLARKGNPEAQFYIGLMFHEGKGTQYNLERAFLWLSAAAKKGVPQAQFNLSLMYSKGQGVKKNDLLAFRWMEKAANQELPEALVNLSTFYYSGTVVKKDAKKVFELLQVASKQDYPEAQIRLASMYYTGEEIEQNYKTAFEYAQQAATQNLSAAQYMLAIMYIKGKGIPKNTQKGINLLCSSAENGYELAQIVISVICLMEGNEKLAEKWLDQVREKGIMQELFLDKTSPYILKSIPSLSELKRALSSIKNKGDSKMKNSNETISNDAIQICTYVLDIFSDLRKHERNRLLPGL